VYPIQDTTVTLTVPPLDCEGGGLENSVLGLIFSNGKTKRKAFFPLCIKKKIMRLFVDFFLLVRLLLKVTMLTTEHHNWPKMGKQNKKNLGRSALQEL
jgi:hypothetical protein